MSPLAGNEKLNIVPAGQLYDTPYTIVFLTNTTPVYIEGIRRRAPREEVDFEEESNQGVVELRLAEDTFDQLTFQRGDSEAACFRRMDGSLIYRIYLHGRRFKLSAAQKRQLLLAGRGDLQRLRNRLNDLRERFKETHVVQHSRLETAQAWAIELVDESKEMRQLLAADPFPEGSMLSKVLRRQLTPEQIVEYERREIMPPSAE